jgi:AraC-like DNA-binding protein
MNEKTFQFSEKHFNNFNIEIISNGLFRGDKSWNFIDVVSPFNRLYFVLSGEGYLVNEKHKIKLSPGNVYLIPSGAKYSYKCDKSIYKLYFHFNLQLIPGMDIFDGLNQCIYFAYSLDVINKLIEFLNSQSLLGILKFKAILNEFIADFMEKATYEYGLKWEYKAFMKYNELLAIIYDNLYADIRIKNLADSMKISYYSLSRNFKLDTGIGLKKYAEKMLLKKSKQLLLTTTMNISEISEQLHFCDQYYFSRFFKKYAKIPPKEYRKKYSESRNYITL